MMIIILCALQRTMRVVRKILYARHPSARRRSVGQCRFAARLRYLRLFWESSVTAVIILLLLLLCFSPPHHMVIIIIIYSVILRGNHAIWNISYATLFRASVELTIMFSLVVSVITHTYRYYSRCNKMSKTSTVGHFVIAYRTRITVYSLRA